MVHCKNNCSWKEKLHLTSHLTAIFTQGVISSQSKLPLYQIHPCVVYGQACLNPVFRYMASIAAPNSGFSAIDSDINRQGLDSAAVHGVEERHPLCTSHPRAVEPGLLVIFTRKWRFDVDIWAISYRKFFNEKSWELRFFPLCENW